MKSQFHKIIRACLRKIAQFNSQHKNTVIPDLVKLSDNRIRVIMRSHCAENIRLKILEVFNQTQVTEHYLKAVVETIN